MCTSQKAPIRTTGTTKITKSAIHVASVSSISGDRNEAMVMVVMRREWLLLLRRIVLEDLGHRVGDALVALVRLGLRVHFLHAHAAPHDLVLLDVGHVDDQRADQDVAHLGRRGAAAAPAAAPPVAVRPVAAAVARA